jgi:hypothetical protein
MKELLEELKKYAELRLELLKISAAELLISAAASLFVRMLTLVIFVSSIVMLEIACGLALRNFFDDWSTGFFLISGLNFFTLIVVLLFQKSIISRIQDYLSNYLDTDEISRTTAEKKES